MLMPSGNAGLGRIRAGIRGRGSVGEEKCLKIRQKHGVASPLRLSGTHVAQDNYGFPGAGAIGLGVLIGHRVVVRD